MKFVMSDFKLHSQLANDSYYLGDFELSALLLINDKQFPWMLLVPRRANIREIYQLEQAEQLKLWQESQRLSQGLMELYKGDKLNIAALGNMVPQLHLHHIVRFKDDLCWPAPVWGKLQMKPYDHLDVVQIQAKIVEKITDLEVRPL